MILAVQNLPPFILAAMNNPDNIVQGSANLSNTSNTAIIAAHSNAALRIYVLWLAITNLEATLRDIDLTDSDATVLLQLGAAASGGGLAGSMPLCKCTRGKGLSAINNTAGGSPSINVSAIGVVAR